MPPSLPEPASTHVRFTGAVYTPQKVAAALVDRVSGLLPDSALSVLEPSVGDGAFLREMRRRWAGDHFTLVDIDNVVIEDLRQQELALKSPNATLHAQDFVGYAVDHIRDGSPPFDLIIGNPPFIRSRNFSETLQASVDALAQAVDYARPQIKNSWAAFLAASARLVAPHGVVALVLPYELITVAYGQAALRRLTTQFKRIDIYVSREKAFPEIDQDAIILIAQKAGRDAPGLFMNQVDRLSELSAGAGHALDLSESADASLELNSFLLASDTVSHLKELRKRCHQLSHFAGSAPGIVSAANEFFILKKTEIDRLGFGDLAYPILKKGSIASHKPVFTAGDFETIADSEPAHILRLTGDRQAFSKPLQDYLETGEKAGYHLRYKCRKRSNWYEVPFVPKETAFFFKRAHSYPRLCINEADVYLTDTAYGLRIKEEYTARGLCFSFYNTLTLLFAEIDGRFYGGGVLEVSPTEFRGLPIVYHEPTKAEFASFLKAHEQAKGDPKVILDFGDRWLASKLDLNPAQMMGLRTAWEAVRGHRLRHSGRHSAGDAAVESVEAEQALAASASQRFAPPFSNPGDASFPRARLASVRQARR